MKILKLTKNWDEKKDITEGKLKFKLSWGHPIKTYNLINENILKMDKSLDACNKSKLNSDEINNLSRSTFINKIQVVI